MTRRHENPDDAAEPVGRTAASRRLLVSGLVLLLALGCWRAWSLYGEDPSPAVIIGEETDGPADASDLSVEEIERLHDEFQDYAQEADERRPQLVAAADALVDDMDVPPTWQLAERRESGHAGCFMGGCLEVIHVFTSVADVAEPCAWIRQVVDEFRPRAGEATVTPMGDRCVGRVPRLEGALLNVGVETGVAGERPELGQDVRSVLTIQFLFGSGRADIEE